jgi:formylmethanofuran dehydrogenase subunit E
MERCSVCQRDFEVSEGVFFENRWFCRECSIAYGQFENCSRCRRSVARWDYTTHNAIILCNECYDKVLEEERLARVCAICKKEISGPSVIDPRGRKVCIDCYRKNNLKPFGVKVIECVSCKEEVPEPEITFVKEKPVCKKCIEKFMRERTFLICSSCGSKIYGRPLKVGKEVLCPICYSQVPKGEDRCAVCGKVIRAIKFVRRDGAVLCLDCSKKESESSR